MGEAFRPVVDSRYVRAGYAISWAYVLGDVGFQVKRAHDEDRDYIRAGVHAATFQTFGSSKHRIILVAVICEITIFCTVLIPALIIHTVVHQSEKAFHKVGIKNRWASVSVSVKREIRLTNTF